MEENEGTTLTASLQTPELNLDLYPFDGIGQGVIITPVRGGGDTQIYYGSVPVNH